MKHAVKHIHFVGIGGSGMSGIAQVLHHMGYRISGSDVQHSPTTAQLEKAGVQVYPAGHAASHVQGADVVVISSAVHEDNPEVQAARALHIPVIPRALMLVELMRNKRGIAIAGTHGKTTTTSLVASVLAEAGLDPTYVIGGVLSSSGSSACLGQSEFMVVEADESDASFLNLLPTLAVVTNIDQDHMETYGHQPGRLQKAFLDFLHRMPFYGTAIVCLDDPQIRQILPDIARPLCTYGLGEVDYAKNPVYPGNERGIGIGSKAKPNGNAGEAGFAGERNTLSKNTDHTQSTQTQQALQGTQNLNPLSKAGPSTTKQEEQDLDLRAVAIRAQGTQMHFVVQRRAWQKRHRTQERVRLPDLAITLNIPGLHNVRNALAAIAVAMELDIPDAAVQRALAEFKGVGRRFQQHGLLPAARGGHFLLVDDYGHHPQEIAATVAAARQAYPTQRLVLAFQPHRYTRTRDCFDDFVKVLSQTDVLLLCQVYAAGESPIVAADGHALARAIRVAGLVEPVFVEDIADLPPTLAHLAQAGDVVLCMGAGSMGKVPDQLKAYTAQYADQAQAHLLQPLQPPHYSTTPPLTHSGHNSHSSHSKGLAENLLQLYPAQTAPSTLTSTLFTVQGENA
jgi:UDP-N-acetylmuramate-alanine ligase